MGDVTGATTRHEAQSSPVSKVPTPLRFPLAVILNLCLTSLLYSFAADYTAGELASVSRSLNEWWEVGILMFWKTTELGIGWYCDYDSYDLAALSLLSHGPPLYLLGAFYDIRPITVLLSLVIDTLATSIPFRLLRPLSPAHAVSSFSSASYLALPNHEVVTDFSIQCLTTILAAGIYSVSLFTAYSSFLPVTLVTYFNDIPTIATAHSATMVTLLPLSLALGFAARTFIFTPAAVATRSPVEAEEKTFNQATASFGESFKQNVWDIDARENTIITRTLTLIFLTGGNTFVQCFMTIEGVEALGAITYAAVWAIAAGLTGVSLGLVGAV